MPRVAHISDIHFGKTFDVDIWNKVRHEIEIFQPSIIVVSGDFTDSPSPLMLLAAKLELQRVAASCGTETEFFVVPGNHDLLDFGNIIHPFSSWWFEHVMFKETRELVAIFERGLSFEIGLNKETLRWLTFSNFRRLNPKRWLWPTLRNAKCDGRRQSCDFHRGGEEWPTNSVHDQTLITCFDSNPSPARAFLFATGEVAADQITRTGTIKRLNDCPFCEAVRASSDTVAPESAIRLRMAVLHHHPLPIAVRSKSLTNQRAEAKLEPFLILRNGGDFVHELQRQKFDVVLHGHKHRPQFARVELRADDPEGYPLLILAGGSTAKNNEDVADNTLRLLRIESSGRLVVTNYESGLRQERRDYREPINGLKRRAFASVTERAKICADELISNVEIDAVGHLHSWDRTNGLRVTHQGTTINGMVISVILPSHDRRVNIALDEQSRSLASLSWRDPQDQLYGLTETQLPKGSYCWLSLAEPLQMGSSRGFGVHEAAANSIAMTRWELAERSRSEDPNIEPEHEEVGYFVTYPVEKFALRLRFPAALDGITPEVRCYRYPGAPNFPLTFRPEERAISGRMRDYPLDHELTDEESKRLRYEARERRWILEIDRPIPGNFYQLRWKVPNLIADKETLQRTRAFQRRLLTLANNSSFGNAALESRDVFIALAEQLMKRFRSEINPDEQQTAFLMVYDESDLCLRPVLSYARGGSLPEGSYDVPLGGGVAGAAFLQRRILAWENDPDSKSLIKPPTSANLNSSYVLALPIFHQKRGPAGNPIMDLEPGATIGVVTLGSDEVSSRIIECTKEDETAKQIGQEAQLYAQESVFELLEKLASQTV